MSPSDVRPEHRPIFPIALTLGFAAAAAMWVAGFIARLPAVQLAGPATAAMLGAILFLACLRAGYGRATPARAVICGVATALVAALVNCMMLGSLLTDDTGAAHPNTALAVLGFFAASAALGAIAGGLGGHLGRNRQPGPDQTGGRAQFAAFAIIAAIAVLPVLLVGGLVTSHEAGLAVPDWPTSYGLNMVLFPLSRMTGGIYYEHSHRLFGMLAGLGAVLLVGYAAARALAAKVDMRPLFGLITLVGLGLAFARNSQPALVGVTITGVVGALVYVIVLLARRRFEATDAAVRKRDVALAIVALIAVGLQGVLGGVRVTGATGSDDPANITTVYEAAVDAGTTSEPNFALTEDTESSRSLALVHGVAGQLTFALLCIIAAMLCPAWLSARNRAHNGGAHPPDRTLQAFAYFLIGAVLLQLIMGAMVRHTHQAHALYTHIGLAFIVVFLAMIAGMRAVTRQRHIRNLRRFGNGALHSVLAQFALGWAALFVVVPNYDEAGPDPTAAVLVATAHQFLGALVLAFSALLAAWTWRETAANQQSTKAANQPG